MWLVCLCGVALAAPVDADDVVAGALAHDPSLAAAEAELRVAEGAVRAARGLQENPQLSARLGWGVPQHEVSLTQPVSLSGEGRAARQSAELAQQAALARLERRRLEVAAQARASLITAVQASASLRVAEESADLAKSLREVAELRLAAGDGNALEVQLARLEEAAAVAGLIAATRADLHAREDLAALCGLPPDVELPSDPLEGLPLRQASSETRSDVLAAQSQLASAEADLRRARAAVLPPVELGVWAQAQNMAVTVGPNGVIVPNWSWEQNVGWSVGPSLGVTLPLWHANPVGRGQAQAALRVSDAALEATEARAEAELSGVEARALALEQVAGLANPSDEASAALQGIGQALAAGEIGVGEASLLRARVLDAWVLGEQARAEAAMSTLELALVEEWPTLLGELAP